MTFSRPVADKASLSGIRRSIRAELARAGVDPAQCFDCLVAVTEACTNALLHGLGSDEESVAPEIRWEIDSEQARFYVKDFSTRGWSRASHPAQRSVGTRLEERAGGWGLDLMAGLMDEAEIEVGPSGTTVCLVKRFAS